MEVGHMQDLDTLATGLRDDEVGIPGLRLGKFGSHYGICYRSRAGGAAEVVADVPAIETGDV